MRNVNVSEIENQLGSIQLIDCREEGEFRNGHIPTSKHIPVDDLLDYSSKHLNKNDEYYIVCQSGGKSKVVCGVLETKGYQVVNVLGGISRFPGQLEV